MNSVRAFCDVLMDCSTKVVIVRHVSRPVRDARAKIYAMSVRIS